MGTATMKNKTNIYHMIALSRANYNVYTHPTTFTQLSYASGLSREKGLPTIFNHLSYLVTGIPTTFSHLSYTSD